MSQPASNLAPHVQAALKRHLATHGAMVDRATEALRRTRAIVDRLLPELPASGIHPFPSRSSVENGWAAIDRATARKRLFRAIKPRIDAKLRERAAIAEAPVKRRAA